MYTYFSFFMSATKHWLFTLNNFTVDEFNNLRSPPEWVSYLVFQHERGNEGTDHLQGYLELAGRYRMSRLRDFLPRAHWEPRRGSQAQAIAYCSKADTRVDGPWTVGIFEETRAGQRKDLDELALRAYSGTETLHSLQEAYPGHCLRYRKSIKEALLDHRRKLAKTIQRDLEVVILWGDPGTGKTRSVYESEGMSNVYTLNTATNGTLWFDGYDGESVLLIDDFRGWIRFNEVLKICDRYPYRLAVKGSFDYASWTKVYFTSNHNPETWWSEDSGHCFSAFRRRVARVEHFSSDHPWVPSVAHSDDAARTAD
nr:replication associated protein [Bidens cyclovirus-like]